MDSMLKAIIINSGYTFVFSKKYTANEFCILTCSFNFKIITCALRNSSVMHIKHAITKISLQHVKNAYFSLILKKY